MAARFYKLIITADASKALSSPCFSKFEEMFYFKSKQIFAGTVTVQPKEQIVSNNRWVSQSVIMHTSIEYISSMEFEGIIVYSLVDADSGAVVKVVAAHQKCEYNSTTGASMIVFLELDDLSLLTEEYFERKYYLIWESSVLCRKGCIPLKIEPIPKPAVTVHFDRWESKSADDKLQACLVKVSRLDSTKEQVVRVYLPGSHVNSKCFLQSKTILLLKKEQASLELPITALFLTADSFVLEIEVADSDGSNSSVYKSPHALHIR